MFKVLLKYDNVNDVPIRLVMTSDPELLSDRVFLSLLIRCLWVAPCHIPVKVKDKIGLIL